MTTRQRGRPDIGDIDDVDVLETYDWNEDPWDASLGVGEVEQVRTQTRAAKWVGYSALALANLLIIAGGIYGWWYIRQANAPGDTGGPVEFVIAEGEDLQALSERLEDEGIVENASFFERYVADHGGLDVTPGYYRLPTGDHVGNVLARLRTSPEETFIEITFPEGFTLQQIAARLANELPQLSAEEFMAAANDPTIPATFRPAGVTSMEGLVFPMIEREAKTDEDRPLIARVIYNRLAIGQALEIDATLLYNAPPELVDPEIDFAALRARDTPWNTYMHTGLPQTPIANPGRASIEAALHPAPNPSPGNELCTGLPANQCMWLYYVVEDEQGNHAFAVTGEQHAANVQRARDAGLLD